VLIELDVEELIDMFEDNVDIARDYLAWLSRSSLELIETRLGHGPRAAGVLHEADRVESA
jgi:hypothetical protein